MLFCEGEMPEGRFIKNVFDWEHFFVYLSGPIDFDPNRGRGWREDWTEELIKIGFGKNQIINPCCKPLPKNQFTFDLDNEAVEMQKRREAEDYEGLCDVVSQIAHIDLRFVDKSDIVLANFPLKLQHEVQSVVNQFENAFDEIAPILKNVKDATRECFGIRDAVISMKTAFDALLTRYMSTRIPTYGTVHEIVNARIQHKPTMIVWEGGKKTCSGWMMWLVGHNHVFSTFDEVLDRLKKISQGEAAYNAKDWLLFDFSV